jgi:hypothetical protein
MNNGPYNLYLKLENFVDTLTQMFKEDNPHPRPSPPFQRENFVKI